MTRSRSGSFYCPLEPAWAPLSISQKAAISTAVPASQVQRPSLSPRRHTRSTSFRIGSGDYEHPSKRQPFLSTPDLSSVYGFGTNAALAHQPQGQSPHSSSSSKRRHAHSPARPSPLRGETFPGSTKPLSPSAIWTSGAQQGTRPNHHHHRPRTSVNTSCSSLHRSVLKSAFMAGPMAHKARMYGLRVAWCVFGDARVEMARDIFGRGSTSAGIVGGDAQHATPQAEMQREESVEMPVPEHERIFEWEVDSSRAKSRIVSAIAQGPSSTGGRTFGYSYMALEQLDPESDESDSDSDYDSQSDEETESAESDELDDEDEIQRHVMAALEQTHLGSGSSLDKHAHDVNAHWEIISFEG